MVELLVVVAIIALLVTILVPTIAGLGDNARDVTCQSNIGQMAAVIAAAENPPHPGGYRKFIRDCGMSGVMNCPSYEEIDDDVDDKLPPDLEDIYLVQKQGGKVLFSNMKIILDTGTSPEDGQVKVVGSAHGVTALEGQMLVTIGSECAMIRVTYGSVVKFESIIVPTRHTGHNSIHWLCLDTGTESFRSYVERNIGESNPNKEIFLMRLQSGHRYTTKAPDFEVGFKKASYAMSDAISRTKPRPGQIMLVEYSKDIAKIRKQGYRTDRFGYSNSDPNGFLRTRHFGRANYATTDGSVKAMTREQLQWEYDQYTASRHNGIWAP